MPSADAVVGALPGSMGKATLETVILAGKDVVDIALFPEDPFELEGLARTTGYTGTAGVHLLADGMFGRKGICPPELVGEDALCTEFVLAHLAARGVRFTTTIEPVEMVVSTPGGSGNPLG